MLNANILLRAVFGARVRTLLETYEDSVSFYTPDIASLSKKAAAIQELFRVIEVHAVGHGGAGVRQGCSLVGDAGLSCLSVERQDGVVFYEGYEPLRLPGAPNHRQQHYGCENLHVDAPEAVEYSIVHVPS
jgi:hypothetical protein